MNAPIQATYQTAQNLYAVLINPVDGTVFNTITPGYEAYNSGHWANYAVPLVEYAGSGYYRATYPIATPLVLSTEVIYVRGGVSPALGDVPATAVGQSQGVNVGAAGNSWQAGQNFAAAVGAQQKGAIVGTPTSPTILPTNLLNPAVEAFAGRAIIMLSGVLIQQAAFIIGYNGGGLVTVNGFPSGGAPADGDAFIII